jgi:acetyltransferase-like isoleucine patch superfamily enzyme
VKYSAGRIVKKAIDWISGVIRGCYYRCIYLSWVDFGPNIVFSGPVHCHGITGTITIGSRTFLGGDISLSVAEGGKIELGEDCSLNRGCIISALSKVSIGNAVRIGEYSSIRDNDHATDGDGPIWRNGFHTAAVVIEDGAWIGKNVTIMPGSHVGAGAIVGANAFVKGMIPPRAIVVGSPAKVVRMRDASNLASD